MNRTDFIIFTALISYLRDLGLNPAEYLSKEELLRYTEVGEQYIGMETDDFKKELKEIIKKMAGGI